MQRTARIATLVIPFAMAAAVLSAAFVPNPASPGITLAIGLLGGGALAIVGGLARRRDHSVGEGTFAIAGLACAIWFAVTSLGAVNPAISFMGMIAQHNGLATWLLGVAWLLAALLLADKRTLRAVLAVCALLGVAWGLAAAIEVVTGGLADTQDHARAFFENSVSFGQFMAITTVGAAAWVLSGRLAGPLRWLAWTGVGFLGWMIAVSDSRTGFLALAVALAVAALTWRFPASTERGDRTRAVVLTAIPVVLNAALVAAATGMLGARPAGVIARYGTGRDDIWRAAWNRFLESPVAGEGLDHFSTWTSWRLSSAFFESKATTDPHNLALAVGLGGGTVGLVLATIALGVLVLLSLKAAHSARSLAVSVAASLPLALVAAGSVGWIAPATMLVATAVIGAVIGAAPPATAARPTWATQAVRVAALALGGAAIVAGVVGIRNVSLEVRNDSQTDPNVLVQMYDAWPDPAYAANGLQLLASRVVAGDPAAAQSALALVESSADDATRRVEVAAASLVALQALEARDPGRFPEFERAVEAGMQADPGSGFWYTFGAIEAARLELAPQAAEYARKALTFEVPEATRVELEQIAE